MQEYQSLIEVLDAFPDEAACVKHLEQLRWPCGIICPLCGESRKFHRITRGHRYKCADCKREFSVRKGTIFEESRLPLRKWFVAAWLVSTHRKGIPSTQLAREVGVTQKTAWFMLGRLREVANQMNGLGRPVGEDGGEVEADETYMGGKRKNMSNAKRKALKDTGRGTVGKAPVAGVRDRMEGRIKLQAVSKVDKKTLHQFIESNVATGATLYTDEHGAYLGLVDFDHHSVSHSVGEYVRGQAHTNGIESFWALLKRGYVGTFHHFTWKHLHRYLDEFEARWNLGKLEGGLRLNKVLDSASGRRLTYADLIA